MSIEAMLTAPEKALREEMQAFVQPIPRQLLLDMDADKVAYPREYLQEAARRNLLGLRFEPRRQRAGMWNPIRTAPSFQTKKNITSRNAEFIPQPNGDIAKHIALQIRRSDCQSDLLFRLRLEAGLW
ncbi:MAG: hypothetical protein QMD04_01115 [Anaerolineales bacterium]|nr:hypothetical protein [Anaerolineales bacterium]